MIFPWTKLSREINALKTDIAMVRANLDVTHKSLCEAVDIAQERQEIIKKQLQREAAYMSQLESHRYQRKKYANTLQDIAAQEKPTSNATVKRMARMAREALK